MTRDRPSALFLLRNALIDLRKHTHRSWYHPVDRMHTGTFGKKSTRRRARHGQRGMKRGAAEKMRGPAAPRLV